MPDSKAIYSVPARPGGHPRLLLLCVVAGVVLAAILLAHGAVWWSAPLAVVALVVLGHLAALAVLLVVAMLLTHSGHRHGGPRGDLLRRPRLYDWMVRVLSGGRERPMRAAWLDVADLHAGEAVLDVGSGTGSLLLAAAGRVGPTGLLRGLEASPDMISHARAKALQAGVDVEFATGSADALPYADDSFDVILSTLVFHHLPADLQEAALAEFVRVLRPGGRVVIVDLPHGAGAPGGRFRSLIELLHGNKTGRVIDVHAALAALGARELTRHPAGIGALQATRAVFS